MEKRNNTISTSYINVYNDFQNTLKSDIYQMAFDEDLNVDVCDYDKTMEILSTKYHFSYRREKRMVNKKHPDFLKYKTECDTLRNEYWQRANIIGYETEKQSGKDGESTKIAKEFVAKLKQLQKKYFYLFE